MYKSAINVPKLTRNDAQYYTDPILSVPKCNWCTGALKMTDMKLQDMKLTDRVAGHEIAGHENGGPNSRT